MKHRAVFLDRDGTLVHPRHYLSCPEDLRLYKNIGPGLRDIQRAGFRLMVMMNIDRLKGKVVLVTGAGSDLGEATAWAIASAGCSVACVDIDGQEAGRVCQDMVSQDATSIAIRCDVSEATAVVHTVQMVHEQFKRLDIIVNCAAIDYTLSVDEMTVEQWDRVMNVNLRGPFLLAKAALPIMR
jgi:NAD(P)-dependent dehydrogenase (short-subunit alcohol dehydrogenase family)